MSGAADPVDGGGLLHLKHAYNLSDEATCECWRENCYWQYSTGEVYFQTRLPCDPSPFTHWRQRLGEAGMEELLAHRLRALAGRALVPYESALVFPENCAEIISFEQSNPITSLKKIREIKFFRDDSLSVFGLMLK